MKRVAATICALLLGSVTLAADQGKSHGPKKSDRDGYERSEKRDHGGTSIQFSVEQVRVIREHYAPQYRSLPPGLQKKYARTGKLPPGWQKKMQPMPVVIEREMPRLAVGYSRGVIDGHAVIYHQSSGTIIDVAVLF